MPTVATYKAICAGCKREFPYPSLGDYAYGCFILHREDGRAFRYLQAVDNDVWDFVAARLPAKTDESITLLQEVVARLADRSESHSFTMAMVCPYCKSRYFRDWHGEDVASVEIPEATFQTFGALGNDDKESLVSKLANAIRAEP